MVQQLLAAGLVDELRLLVHPVAARTGRRLFDDGHQPYHLTLLRAEVFPTGVIRAIYAPTKAPGHVGYDEVTENLTTDPERGEDEGEHDGGVGLSAMRERAEELGGSLGVSAERALGTMIRARLPLPSRLEQPVPLRSSS